MFNVKKDFSCRFDSTNFKQVHYGEMEAVTKTQGLYGHLTGNGPRPSVPLGRVTGPKGVTPIVCDTVTPEEYATWQKESLAWDKEDLQLMGIIQITTTKEVFDPIKDMNAQKAWEQLNDTYGEPTLSAIYGDFVKLISFRLTTSHPQAGITKFKSYIEQFSEVGVVLPELIKSLLLIAAIPPEWDAASSKSLHDYVRDPEDDDTITVAKVQEPAAHQLRLASYASVIASPTPVRPYSSITDCRECIALNMV
ncbi:hypothetical protein AAF712_014408 [Marasmius tenuissimus]|uniref:Gag-pol polyprotein n=1 Tax=Marasmius tenuissimus TaxID=585030 RepID=A0ABR2ZCF2_9AGAR